MGTKAELRAWKLAKKTPLKKRYIPMRQRLFIEFYCKHGKASKAALEAGYANGAVGHTLTDPEKHPEIVEMINRRLAELRAACLIEAKHIVAELSKIAFFNIKDLLDDDGCPRKLCDISDSAAAAISHMRISYCRASDGEGGYNVIRNVDIKFHPKLEALKQLAQHLGLLKEMTINNTLIAAINWDELTGQGSKAPRDLIEERIEELTAGMPMPIQEVIDVEADYSSDRPKRLEDRRK